MTVFDKRVTRTVRTEYRLRVPVHASEMYKALQSASTDIGTHVDRFPRVATPELFVTNDDEHVVVYWEHEQADTVTRGFTGFGDGQQP